MKKTKCIFLMLISVLAYTGVAMATPVSFNVGSSITGGANNTQGGNYNKTSGIYSPIANSADKYNFIWTAAAGPLTQNFNLNVGQSLTVKYGTFTTQDIPISNNDLADYLLNTVGNFGVLLNITPPIPGAIFGRTGTPEVLGQIKANASGEGDALNTSIMVDFDNNFINTAFGNGGLYSVAFNDITNITANGPYDLTYTIKLESAPVPEPGTMVLFGVGMLGLAIYGKRRMNKEA